MFGLTRWNSFDDVFNFQREMDRVFNQFWNELPTRTATPSSSSSPSLQVTAVDDGWRVDVPLPGIDPKDVALEVAGNNLSIRAEVSSEGKDRRHTLRADAGHSAVPRPRETHGLPPTRDAAADASPQR